MMQREKSFPAPVVQQKEAVKMQLTKAAKEHGIDLEIYRFIDAEHQDSLWYGGVIATAKKGSLRCEISAQGDVYASLLRCGREIADVRDKCNGGEFYYEMGKFIPNDNALLILQRGAKYGDLELHLENGNWFEWNVFDEARGEWIGPDSLDNIAEVDGVAECLDPKYLETIFDYALEYEKGGYHRVF